MIGLREEGSVWKVLKLVNGSSHAAGQHQILPITGEIGDGNDAKASGGVLWTNNVLVEDVLAVS